jgi:uncharacterized repeat protein (TIGR03806 family)
VPPVIEHPHSEFRSIVGGFVYQGRRFPELRDAYLYGDHETGKVRAFRYEQGRIVWQKELADSTIKFLCIAADHHGELYLPDFLGGEIFRLTEAPRAARQAEFPRRLSDTGLFASTAGREPMPGVILYDVNSPLWSDGAEKERFLALPGDSQIVFHPDRSWEFPDGTVLVKTFSLPLSGRAQEALSPVETRLLTQYEGQWLGYSYRWNADGSDAELVEAAGIDRDYDVEDAHAAGGVRRQRWHFPSRAECMVCHTRAASYVLGVTTAQMNRTVEVGGRRQNQLKHLERLGIFRGLLEPNPDEYARLCDPYDTAYSVGQRARSYLHSNCSHCHVADGGGNARLELGFRTSVAAMGLVGARPQHTTFDVPDALLVCAGDAGRSILVHRVGRVGAGRMPPLASSVVDQRAVELLTDWINALAPDP